MIGCPQCVNKELVMRADLYSSFEEPIKFVVCPRSDE
jgi:hypothetical protein